MTYMQFQPVWPETVVFWGAGATQALKMPTTGEQTRLLYLLAAENKKLEDRVKQVFKEPDYQQDIIDLLNILGDSRESSMDELDYDRQFPGWSWEKIKNRVEYLRSTYNWGVLRDLIHICPGRDADTFKLQDLFNLIDMHVQAGQGFYVRSKNADSAAGSEVRFVPPESLIPARNALNMLIGLMFYVNYQSLIKHKDQSLLTQYSQFADILYQIMVEEGIDFYKREYPMVDRRFYLFSYAIISMNWDPLLLWFLFNAHKKGNFSPRVAHLGHPAQPLKMFHDLGHFMGVRKIDGDKPDVWFPFNETVVQRVNDPEHITSRRVRVGKFYFPHGCIGWRECPNCGKLMMYMGNEWKTNSPSLFPPQLLESLSKRCLKARSQEEETAHKQGKTDVLQCPFCGTLTELRHTPIIMQSNFKGSDPSFVEEIQKDMRVSLERARHIVLMGYTLPSDDVAYRSILSARQDRHSDKGPFCSVIIGKDDNAPDHWLEGQELESYLAHKKDSPFAIALRSAQDIFGKENVRGYACGIPQVFLDSKGHASRDKILELLYPQNHGFPGHRVMREEKR